jgi:hypothetical protein
MGIRIAQKVGDFLTNWLTVAPEEGSVPWSYFLIGHEEYDIKARTYMFAKSLLCMSLRDCRHAQYS